MTVLTPEQQRIIAELLDEGAKLRRFRKLDYFEPYLKQQEFFANGARPGGKVRAIIAANQVGKTLAGSFEDAVHLTGDYPSWWRGHRFTTPTAIWIAGPKADKVRDTTQEALFGSWKSEEAFGTGFIPRDALCGRPTLARGVSGAYDVGSVKWKDKNGWLDESARSSVKFMCYTDGVLAFASENINGIHWDEEPPGDIRSEGKVRLQVRDGIEYLTLTPLLGRTDVIRSFDTVGLKTQMGIYDACIGHDPSRPHLGHYTREQADQIVVNYPAHERDARAFGVPMMGEGRIFLTDENVLKVPPFEIPHYWFKIGGLDFGGQGERSHPFAYVLLAIDRENDIVYLVHSIRLRGVTKLQHVPAIRAIAADVPVAWPHDGNERRDGTTVADQYRAPMPGMPGLQMLPKHATWPDGGFSTWAAVNELDDRCKTDRFKVFDTPANALWFEEYRQFHQELDKTGQPKIVPIDDDLLSATFKGLMMKRVAKAVQVGPKRERFAPKPTADEWAPKKPAAQDFDPVTGRAIDKTPGMW